MTLLVAGLAGFAVLAVEILGVHLLAPWFGTSALVWSQQIGLVLAAIAVGGWLGGRLAARSADPQRSAAWCLLIGGGLMAIGIGLLAPFAMWLLSEGLTLENAAAIFQRGSFTAATLFFVPPVLYLAMLSPLLVQIRAAERGPGRAAGEVSAAGTVGSLLGVFGSSFVAIPMIGVRTTLILTTVALLLGGVLLLKKRKVGAAALLPLALLLLNDPSHAANLPEGAEVLAVEDSPYQHLRVIGFEGGERWLQMNEGLDSYQSLYLPDSTWPGGYYDLFSLAPIYANFEVEEAQQRESRAWILGYGAGSAVSPLQFGFGDSGVNTVGVELDPKVVELGEQWLPLAPEVAAKVQVIAGADARSLLRCADVNLDVILLDAYARQFEIPPHLATIEFFAESFEKLRPGGILAINLGTTAAVESDLGFVARIRAGLASSFGEHQRMHRVPRSRNWVLFARKEMPFPDLAEVGALMPSGLPLAVGAACLPGQTVDGVGMLENVVPYTDDRNPLQLQQSMEWWREAP
jgi:predicted membrane-bound spermidine synthase